MQALVFLYEAHMLPMWDWELEMRLIAESPPEYALIRFLLAFIVLSQLCISLIYASPEVYQDHVDREPAEPRVRTVSRRAQYQPFISSEVYRGHVSKETKQPDREVRKIVRLYQLINRCSGKLLQVVGQNVYANAKQDSEFANLRVETDSFGSRVRIASAKYRNYLCFSRRGRLTVRHSGKSRRCIFQENITEQKYTEFQSVANPLWYIGFRSNGKPLRGWQWTSQSKTKCYQFVKFDFPYADVSNPEDQVGPDVDFKKIITQLWTQEMDKT